MNSTIHTKTITPLFTLMTIALLSSQFMPLAQAVSPPPDGGYLGGNTAEGQNALFSLTNGGFNTAVGHYSLRSDTTGGFNTAIGAGSLFANTGGNNTASGAGALLSNTTGFINTANGAFALFSNTTGVRNTANGASALFSNTTGDFNTANGETALVANTTGSSNTATGLGALQDNTIGNNNTASGSGALLGNTTGNGNTAVGFSALDQNINGSNNIALGFRALANNTTGNNNIALGLEAGLNLTIGNGNIDIGNQGIAGEFATTRIGALQTRTFISGIRGVTTGNADAIPVLIDSAGQLGTMSSSRRFKEEIRAIDKASEAVLALKPVTFHYKNDNKHTPQFGLIAEEVAAVNPHLVIYDHDSQPYTVRYEAVNAMLLNEFLKEHRRNEEQQRQIDALTAQLKEQTVQIQRISAQVEMSNDAPKAVMSGP